MNKTLLLAGTAALSLFVSHQAFAQDASLSLNQDGLHTGHNHHHNHLGHSHHNAPQAPIGVMGSHLHSKGDWMVSYRYMRMHMDGNRDGTDDLSPTEIATTVPNRFFGTPMQPPTLRVVPLEMTTDMHMFGVMYGATDWLTLMAMGMYLDREMDHVTFAGGSGPTVLGEFTTEAKGVGDTRLSGLIDLYNDDTHRIHLNMGLSVPTGSIKERDNVLAPNGMRPNLRLPYAMQLGTGTFDFLPGITYSGHQGRWGWGAQYMGEVRLENENDQGYSHGDKHSVTAWGAHQFNDWLSSSLRFTATTQDEIDGIDDQIVAPVQTADPNNFGGEMIEVGVGFNLKGQEDWMIGHSIGAEFSVPVYRNLNGPQLERDNVFTFGWTKSF
ncbi:MAG: transporter [Bdellovibrionales bacterium]